MRLGKAWSTQRLSNQPCPPPPPMLLMRRVAGCDTERTAPAGDRRRADRQLQTDKVGKVSISVRERTDGTADRRTQSEPAAGGAARDVVRRTGERRRRWRSISWRALSASSRRRRPSAVPSTLRAAAHALCLFVTPFRDTTSAPGASAPLLNLRAPYASAGDPWQFPILARGGVFRRMCTHMVAERSSGRVR